MKRGFALLLAVSCFLAGVILGFLIAPIKQGVSIGNNSGNNTYSPPDEEGTGRELK